MNIDSRNLIAIVNTPMPYGKYKGWLLCDLPENYLVWYHQKGFPHGKLGELLALVYEIKLQGSESILYTLKQKYRIK